MSVDVSKGKVTASAAVEEGSVVCAMVLFDPSIMNVGTAPHSCSSLVVIIVQNPTAGPANAGDPPASGVDLCVMGSIHAELCEVLADGRHEKRQSMQSHCLFSGIE
ncbi:MAG: hypothetical protein KDD83_13235 [Caldilineaceae bacterium]|nr:hypothetical protein [Caldilineaceae bacterium]